jgi:hypothetical protein
MKMPQIPQGAVHTRRHLGVSADGNDEDGWRRGKVALTAAQ